jgi:hypothetical protein
LSENWDCRQSLLESDQLTPKGWVICDGRQIPGLSIEAPDYSDVFVRGVSKGATTDNTNVKYGSDTVRISVQDLPSHTHEFKNYIRGNISIPHSHTVTKTSTSGLGLKIAWEGTGNNKSGRRHDKLFPQKNASPNYGYISGDTSFSIDKLNSDVSFVMKPNTVGNTTGDIANKTTSVQSVLKIVPLHKKIFYIMKYKNM